jgi:hypothetical protein
MLAFIATPTFEFLARQYAVRASWTLPERKRRALVAEFKQQKLGLLLSPRHFPTDDLEKGKRPE